MFTKYFNLFYVFSCAVIKQSQRSSTEYILLGVKDVLNIINMHLSDITAPIPALVEMNILK